MGPHVWWPRWCREREWGLTCGGQDGVEREWGLTCGGRDGVEREWGLTSGGRDGVERGSGASRVVAEMV